jgi:hypothetical protein
MSTEHLFPQWLIRRTGTEQTGIPFIIDEIDAAHLNPKLPIRYRLSVDVSKLKTDAQASN